MQRAARFARTATERPWLLYLLLTPLAHPILENLLFGERALQTAHDVFDDDVPRLFSIAADWRAFGPSLWDPHLTAGNALFAQFALPPLAPDVLLSFVLPPFWAYVLNAALMAFLAGLAMHLFLRDSLRLPAVACFAGGIAATFAFWHYIYGYAALLLPLAILWTERAVSRERRPADVARAAVLVAFMALSSQVQVVALCAGVVLVWLGVTSEAVREGAGAAARFFVPWLAGAALAAPVLLTQLAAIGDSQRTIWTLDRVGDVWGTWLHQLATLLLGVEVGAFQPGVTTYGTWFPGVLGLPLLLASLVIPRTSRRDKAALGLLGALLVADLLAMLAIPLQEDISLLGSFQFIRVRHLVPVAVVINMALAVAWLARPGAVAALSRLRAMVMALAATVAVTAVVAQARAISRPIRQWLRDDTRFVDAPEDLLGAVLIGLAFVAGAATLVALAVVALRRRREWVGRGASAAVLAGAAAVALLVGLGVERFAFVRGGVLLQPGLGAWADWVPPTSAHEFIADQMEAGQAGRTLSVIEHANRQLSAGLDGVDGYETIYPLRYHTLFGALIRPQMDASPNTASYFGTWGNRAYAFSPGITKPIADLLGVRWLLVAGEEHIDPSLRSRYAVQLPVPEGFVSRFEDDGRVVYENPDAFPRAFVVHDVVTLDSRAEVIEALAEATSADLRSTAFLVGSEASGVAGAAGGGADPADRAALVVDTPDRTVIDTSSAEAGILMLADTFARGWTASIDGREARLFPVDVALRGVELPAGEHTVTLEYRPLETFVGFLLAAATALVLLAWVMRSRRRQRISVT